MFNFTIFIVLSGNLEPFLATHPANIIEIIIIEVNNSSILSFKPITGIKKPWGIYKDFDQRNYFTENHIVGQK